MAKAVLMLQTLIFLYLPFYVAGLDDKSSPTMADKSTHHQHQPVVSFFEFNDKGPGLDITLIVLGGVECVSKILIPRTTLKLRQ
jgi:hypothetical protein